MHSPQYTRTWYHAKLANISFEQNPGLTALSCFPDTYSYSSTARSTGWFSPVNPTSKLDIEYYLISVACLNPGSFKLGAEKRSESISGTKRSTASLAIPGRLDGLVIVASVPTASSGEVHLVERRWLEPGGKYQTQVRSGYRERGPATVNSGAFKSWLAAMIFAFLLSFFIFLVGCLFFFSLFRGPKNKSNPGTHDRHRKLQSTASHLPLVG